MGAGADDKPKGLIAQVGARPGQVIDQGPGTPPWAYVAIAIMVWFLLSLIFG